MNETQVTLTGWLGNGVTVRQAGDSPVASFRIACTPRRFNRRTEEWFDADTQWYTVNAWRSLGEHCADSLRVGDPVVVHGKLSAQTWTNAAGVEVTTFEVEAAFVGHDLNRGTSTFAKAVRPTADGTSSRTVPEGQHLESGDVAGDGAGDAVDDAVGVAVGVAA